MRLCLVSSSFYPAECYGGPVSATWGLSRYLAKKGVKVYVSTTNVNGERRLDIDRNRYIKRSDNLFVKYYHEEYLNKFSLSFLLGIMEDIKESDIIYIQYLFHYTVLFSLIFSWFLRKRVIISPRGSFSSFTLSNRLTFIKSLWLKCIIKPFSKNVIWHACSYLEAADIRSYLGDVKIRIVTDGIEFESFQNAEDFNVCNLVNKYSGMNLENVSELIFSIGRLHIIKRFDVLIKAFNIYRKDHKYAKLLIAGENDGAQEQLQYLIRQLRLEESVFLIGFVDHDQKKELLSNCSVFCLSSDFESFGIVVAEALSCGAPVIVSDKTPWKILEEKKYGIFAKNDKQTFYKSLIEIKSINLSEGRSKKFARRFLDWEYVSDNFIESFLK